MPTKTGKSLTIAQAQQHVFIKKNNGSNDDSKNNNLAQPDIASKDKMLNEAINLNDDEKTVVINNNYGTLVLRDKNKILPNDWMRQFVNAVVSAIQFWYFSDNNISLTFNFLEF